MKEIKGKIFGTLIFIALVLFFSLLIFLPKKESAKKIEMIEIKGNKFLSAKDYLIQTKLNDKDLYESLSLPVIKDRLEEHPYILNADVELGGGNTVNVILTEKKMTAVLLAGSEQYFVSDHSQIVPFFPNTKFVDLPVITNPKHGVKRFSLIENDDLIDALKIIYSAKLTSEDLANGLSEINLRNGRDVVLMFSKVSVPIIFGRGEAARKMVYLESFWKNWESVQEQLKNISYLDLRFHNNIYVGSNK